MRTALRKMGNSHGIIIPKPLLAEIGIGAGDPLDIKVKKGKIVIAPVKREKVKERDPRIGWAEASRAIRDAGDDKLVWPEFANEDDKDLKW